MMHICIDLNMTPIYLRIEYFRTRKGWSQAQLARESGVSQSVISRLESGTTQAVSLANLHELAKALGVPAAALIDERED
jgi:transcriptional regulator with XRE-family HTH domain